MRSSPQVSVVLATHGDVHDLPITLGSILAQQGVTFEVILVDDGNPPADRDYILQLAERDERVRVLRNAQNQGLTHSLIRGCESALAPFIARIDCGDIMVPQTRLAEQAERLQRNREVGLVFGAVEIWDLVTGRRWRTHQEEIDHEQLLASTKGPTLGDHNTVMMSRVAYIEAGGYSPAYRVGQDTDLWKRMVRITRVHRMGMMCAVRTLRAGSISVARNNEQIGLTVRSAKQNIRKAFSEHAFLDVQKQGLRLLRAQLKLALPIRARLYLRHRRSMDYLGRVPRGAGDSLEAVAEHLGVSEWADFDRLRAAGAADAL